MDADERERLFAVIEESIAQADAGQTIPFEQAMAELHAKRLARRNAR